MNYSFIKYIPDVCKEYKADAIALPPERLDAVLAAVSSSQYLEPHEVAQVVGMLAADPALAGTGCMEYHRQGKW